MNIKRCLQASNVSNCTSIGLLVVRLVMGVAFIMHGWGKIQTPFGWMGPDAPVPGIFQLLAAVAEFGGGIALIIGLLVPLASFGLFCTMAVATGMHAFVMGDPFVAKGGGSYELPLVYLTLTILFMMAGPGKYSADAKIFGTKN